MTRTRRKRMSGPTLLASDYMRCKMRKRLRDYGISPYHEHTRYSQASG
jgi:hypothetical protein